MVKKPLDITYFRPTFPSSGTRTMTMLIRFVSVSIFLFAAGSIVSAADPLVLDQVISRENPAFRCSTAALVVGRDGNVYLSVNTDPSCIVRIGRDGGNKFSGTIENHALMNATANAQGTVASAHAHLSTCVIFSDNNLKPIRQVKEFLASDQLGWDAPAAVEAGESGDFYAIDQHRDRILRLDTDGHLVRVYAIPPDAPGEKMKGLRVCEKNEFFYLFCGNNTLRCVGFDGKSRWKKNFSLAGQWYITVQPFDADADGNLLVIEQGSGTVKIFAPNGQPKGEVKLQLSNQKPEDGKAWFYALRVWKNEVILKKETDAELFQVYDLATGAQKAVVPSEYERLTVRSPSAIWTAGEAIPFEIKFNDNGRKIAPQWRVWARPLESAEYRAFKWADGKLDVPADAAGLYVIKVTPESQPLQSGRESEYRVQCVVEIRTKDARGSVTVTTPEARVYYGRGEPISFSVAARGPQKDAEVPVVVRLSDGKMTLAENKATLKTGGAALEWALPSSLTAALAEGAYSLIPEAAGYTCIPQRIVIGVGAGAGAGPGANDASPVPFFRVQYGDYGATCFDVNMSYLDTADALAAYLERARKEGFNLKVDRFGFQPDNWFNWNNGLSRQPLEALAKRLEADPLAPSPEKARLAPPLRQILSGYNALGVSEMGILMGNDAGLPLGTGFDNRKPEQILKDLDRATSALGGYPSFRGWSWSSNWWVFDKRGSNAADNPGEKTAYEMALKKAGESGAWDPVLDKVSAIRLGYAVAAQDLFNTALRKLDDKKRLVTAVAAPYRNVESYPPVTLANVDEVDLHIQWEQMGMPFHAPHNVDFYKRPGIRGWGHPEVWNDDGTGGQILGDLCAMVMRGANGAGMSGQVPPWTDPLVVVGHGSFGEMPDDPRGSHYGQVTVVRALNGLLRHYGPLFNALENDDRVAIAVSGRMYKTDDWGDRIMGLHFARELEAYLSCMHAHQPARFVFAEDMKPDSLARFKAVLLVDQRIEPEPALAEALKNARAAGVPVFHDGTCRAGLVKDFTPLGISFDKLEKDPSMAGDDHAYWRFPQYAEANRAVLAKALDAVTPPPAATGNGAVWVSRRKAGQGSYLFALNYAMPDVDPSCLWRIGLRVASRLPVMAALKLSPDLRGIYYDVFALKEVKPRDGVLEADLRTMPMRLYAVLPSVIAQVAVKGPKSVKPGEAFAWNIQIQDANGAAIPAPVPLHVRLTGTDGRLHEERNVVAGATGADGTMTAPLNAAAGNLTFEATELFSGKMTRLTFPFATPGAPVALAGAADVVERKPARSADASAAGKDTSDSFTPGEERFGPHLRDLVVTDNGRLGVMNAMNWDHNLYGIDTDTGKVRWRQKIGHHYAYAPAALKSGFAVEGFDFKSAEGFHLYLADAAGKLERRFALYGVPKRLPFRFVASMFCENKQGIARGDNFAVPPGGAWVASCGDLGVAVWARDGSLLWKHDEWEARRPFALAAPDARTLLVMDGVHVSACDATTGKALWDVRLASNGNVTRVCSSADGKCCVIAASAEGGRIFILRDGKVVRAFPTACEDFAVSADASRIAVVDRNQLKLYTAEKGLQWIFPGDERMRFPRFSPDDKRIVASSDIGTLYVLDMDGQPLLSRDLGERSAPAWLPDGDLMAAGWMGTVRRLDGAYNEKWRSHLAPEAIDAGDKLMADDGVPTARVADWGNAEAQPAAIQPNLLAEIPFSVSFMSASDGGGLQTLDLDGKALSDGKADPPAKPWLPWNYLGSFAETSPVNVIVFDTHRTLLRVNAVTFFEDQAHPESWLRDAKFEVWNIARETSDPVMPLLSNAAVHTHKLPKPVESSRFRVVLPWGCFGNPRMGEIVFHGEKLGCSHPDVVARRPVAVLFDEQDDIKDSLFHSDNGGSFLFEGAYSGTRCIKLRADATLQPRYRGVFAHTIPNFDFEIAENPQPGQYRYLQFAWKAMSPNTKGMSVGVGGWGLPCIVIHAGAPSPVWEWKTSSVGETRPAEWTVVRVDLWDKLKKPTRIQVLCLGCKGGEAAFDQILLGRTEADLPPSQSKAK